MKPVRTFNPDNSVSVVIRLTKEDAETLQRLAQMEERSTGAQARYVVRQYILTHKETLK